MEHELSPTLAAAEGTPPEQPGLEHSSSIEEQLEDAKTRAQQWQMTRFVPHRTQMQLPPHSHAWDLHQVGLGPLPELPEATKPFPIDVTDLTGATIKVEASLDTSVDALRALVHDQTGVDPDLQMLLLDNEIPMEDETLALGAYVPQTELFMLRRGLRIHLTPQDPTKAATRRKLRHEGRKAAEQRAEAERLALAKRRATQKKMACFAACACAVGMVLLIMKMLGCGGLDCPAGYAGTSCDIACDDCSTDAIALLALMGTASVSSWNATTEPCGEGWNDFLEGWHGIKCDVEGGSVVNLRGSETWSGYPILEQGSVVPQGDLCTLTPLINLVTIHLGSMDLGVSGDISDLATLTQLTYLNLWGPRFREPHPDGDYDSRAVVGDISSLGTLTQLTDLDLGRSDVHGPVSGLAPLVHLKNLNLNSCGSKCDIHHGVTGEISDLAPLTRLVRVGKRFEIYQD